MVVILSVVVFAVGLVLETGGVYALAMWIARRQSAEVARRKWKDAGGAEDKEPDEPPSWKTGSALLGFGLVFLASALLFLFAYHLGAS